MDSVQKHPRSDTGISDLPTSPSKKPRLEMASTTMATDRATDQLPRAVPRMGSAAAYDHLQFLNDQQTKEAASGITEFVSPDLLGFTGILKKRYTDFLVNEILPSGQVIHLGNLKAPKRETNQDPRNGSKLSTTEPNANDHEDPHKQKSPVIKQEVETDILEGNVAPTEQEESKAEPSEQNSSPVKQEAQADEHIGDTPSLSVPQDAFAPIHNHDETVASAMLPMPDTSVDHTQKISPHKRVPPPSPSIPLSILDLDKTEPEKAEKAQKATRKKETVLIRQTEQGWVEVDQEQEQKLKDQKAAEDATTGLGSEESTVMKSPMKVSESEEVRYEAMPSTQAQWRAFASAESASSKATGIQHNPEDRSALLTYFGPDIVDAIVALHDRIVSSPHRKSKDYGMVKSAVIKRETRSKIHQDIRMIFNGRIESTTDNDGAMIITAMAEKPAFHARTPLNNDRNKKQNQQWGPSWKERGGDYLHFSLFKENKDTMEAISWLCKELKIKPSAFQFAGTKDKRAVTVQRVSVYHVFIDRLVAAGRSLRGAKIGNFEYRPHPLRLGELKGNQFVMTLRDCDFHYPVPIDSKSMVEGASSIVDKAIKNLSEKGFLNYYGLQRFGTFSTSTDKVGTSMLQGDFKAAVDAILDFSPASLVAAQDPMSDTDRVSRDDQARAHALNSFKITGKAYPALGTLPRKFSAESSIIRHLSNRGRDNDYLGALQSISRNLRLMYVHAYQSLVWNVAASERWKRFGSAVIEGDLVLIDEHMDKTERITKSEEVDEDGEAIVHPSAEDRATDPEDMFTRARALTKEEAESGNYTIFDVVLPTPGYDIIYPENEMGKFYEEFMASERGGALDPHDMRRKWKDISLSGSYRKFLAKPLNEISFEVKVYTSEDKQLVETDLDRLSRPAAAPNTMDMDEIENKYKKSHELETGSDLNDDEPGDMKLSGGLYKDFKIAVILTLQLGSSQYATMALRELMKLGGVKTYKPDFSGGR
ncbi:hypothetical protein ABVK25_005602 [Lepraria finkii]|uniref:TRUD domain-containing protein n=1 Tax=Lepraria finkii TaxID=1340010 RepID=A0ABR4B9F7_9LECA